MNRFAGLSERLRSPDIAQATLLLGLILLAVLAVGWPGGDSRVNDSWSILAPVRNAALALLGAGFGAQQAVRRAGRQGAQLTLLALVAVVVLTWPLELAAQAGSYPALPWYWTAVVPLLTLSGFFGAGTLLGTAVRGPYAGLLAVVAIPALFALLVWFDLAMGRSLANPWTAAGAVSLPYALLMLAMTLPWVWILLPRRGRDPRRGREGDDA